MSRLPARYKQNRLAQLRGFYYAARTGSISRAAEKLLLSQPSVSLQTMHAPSLQTGDACPQSLLAAHSLHLPPPQKGRFCGQSVSLAHSMQTLSMHSWGLGQSPSSWQNSPVV